MMGIRRDATREVYRRTGEASENDVWWLVRVPAGDRMATEPVEDVLTELIKRLPP